MHSATEPTRGDNWDKIALCSSLKRHPAPPSVEVSSKPWWPNRDSCFTRWKIYFMTTIMTVVIDPCKYNVLTTTTDELTKKWTGVHPLCLYIKIIRSGNMSRKWVKISGNTCIPWRFQAIYIFSEWISQYDYCLKFSGNIHIPWLYTSTVTCI